MSLPDRWAQFDDGALDRADLPSDVADQFVNQGMKLIRELTSQLVAPCMQEAGFDYQAVPVSQDNARTVSSRYGLADMTQAASFGYTVPSSADVQVDASAAVSERQRQAYTLALVGSTEDQLTVDVEVQGGRLTHGVAAGCEGRAVTDIFGSRDHYLDVLVSMSRVEGLSNESLTRLYASDLYQTTTSLWTECMRRGGESRFIDIYEPLAADLDLEEQKRVAQLDVACKAESQLIPLFSQFEREWQMANVESLNGDIETLHDALGVVVERVESFNT